MSLESTPTSQRIQIGFFGRTNSGKSSLINAITNQNVSIVSDTEGTTTDSVSKAMELFPLGAVMLTDTAGYGDNSKLAALRKEGMLKVLSKTDIALLVVDSSIGLKDDDIEMIKLFESKGIHYIIAYNKCDLQNTTSDLKENEIYVSALKNINIEEIKQKLEAFSKNLGVKHSILDGLVEENNKILMITPIDSSAPKNRLILPQQMVLRDILDKNGICTVIKETQLEETLKIGIKPDLVITDSQVFEYVNNILPKEIKLTSFSILFARYKGILNQAIQGVKHIEDIKNNDTILISEGCTHHRQCNDIGSVKLPNWIQKYTKKTVNFEYSSGNTFPANLRKYAMIIHCGGCMLNDKEVLNRYKDAKNQNIPISNYGITIAYIKGILNRSTEVFKI